MTPSPSKHHHAKKAAKEGGAVGGLAVLLAIILQSVRANNPDLPWPVNSDLAIAGAATGILTGLFRWIRKLIKRKRHGNPTTR